MKIYWSGPRNPAHTATLIKPFQERELRATIEVAIAKAHVWSKEREELIAELQDALDEIKTLSGLLPICSSCKKIRDDEGYWTQVEVYIEKHSGAQFSHGICPDCIKKLYPHMSGKP